MPRLQWTAVAFPELSHRFLGLSQVGAAGADSPPRMHSAGGGVASKKLTAGQLVALKESLLQACLAFR